MYTEVFLLKNKGKISVTVSFHPLPLSPLLSSPELPFSSDVPNGSALTQENIGLLSNNMASLSLSEEPEGGGDGHDSQRAGVTPTSAP